jgi:Na+/H+ antiporter NhaD/arsenite permease-like protein
MEYMFENSGLIWAAPFAGMLLSTAVLPMVLPHFWHAHHGKVSAGWATAFLVPLAVVMGFDQALHEILHTLILEYLPFVILLLALYTVAGGLHVRGWLRGTPAVNTGILAFGTAIASIIGTTGATMVLIRPLLRANERRRQRAHLVMFFIFLVGNIGGALSPLGDPPLFLGFLHGVDFFWPTRALTAPTLLVSALLLILFYGVDSAMLRRADSLLPELETAQGQALGLEGRVNLALLGLIVGAVLLSGLWKPGVSFSIQGVALELQNLARDVLLLLATWASLKWTTPHARHGNGFTWGPMKEVAKLFVGIFLTIVPVVAMIKGEVAGTLGGTVTPLHYFWATGLLSAFLDNAPTYLVFFNMGGHDPHALKAISAGAVFMGALTYVGNAPNFMVKAIAEHRHVVMPGFFAFMGWACLILLPVFTLVTWVFF